MSILKTTTIELTPESVNIQISGNDDTCVVSLPLKFIPAQLALQIAGMLSSNPQLPVVSKSEVSN